MYSFIFGAMFGDVGQGPPLFIGGAILYFTKKMNLAGIVSLAGIFSTFFGFMFGSVFGFEDIIEAKWIRPINHMTTLPFIGKLNTVFIVSIAFWYGNHPDFYDLPYYQRHPCQRYRSNLV